MKSLLLVGGILGWVIGTGFSYYQGNAWPTCLWQGCLAGYLTALLMRWWGRAWRKSLEDSVLERERTAQAMLPSVNTPKVSRP